LGDPIAEVGADLDMFLFGGGIIVAIDETSNAPF
jgi:hypothetical protein